MGLTSWKDIAAYVDRGVRTVQRWEREFGFPVHRVGGTVHAVPEEIDDWLQMPKLIGSWTGAVAKTSLLSIPPSLRKILGARSRKFFVTSLDGVSARIYAMEKWELIERHVTPATTEATMKFIRLVTYYGRVSRLTNKGILLPAVICDKANLAGEVNLVGRVDYVGVYRLGTLPEKMR